jgi:ATP-dependent Clp protease ATP-binding subunit ClpX
MLVVWIKFLFLLPLIIYLYNLDRKKQAGQVHLYGIKGYFGLPGTGKTMAMCRELKSLREKYGDKVYIMTNFNYNDQDFPFTSWLDLTRVYDKPLIVAWDEIQNEFNSRDFKNFPIALLTQLTQVRKGNGISLYYTSQRFGFVDKNFRSLSSSCCDCKTILGRYTIVKHYDILDYEELQNAVEVDKKRKIHPRFVDSFIQTEALRNSYDSYAMLETAKYKAKKGEYMSREEIKNTSSD